MDGLFSSSLVSTFELYIYSTGSVLEGAGLGTPPPPCKKLQIEFAREAAYRMSLIEVRLGGWGIEGPQGPTLGKHVSECATILRLRALLYLCASH